jgi:hypothetical protein
MRPDIGRAWGRACAGVKRSRRGRACQPSLIKPASNSSANPRRCPEHRGILPNEPVNNAIWRLPSILRIPPR